MNAVPGPPVPSRPGDDTLRFCVVETMALGDLVYLTSFLFGLREIAPLARILLVTGLSGAGFAFPEELHVEVVAADWPWVNADWWRHPIRSARAILRARRHIVPLSGAWTGLDPRGDVRHLWLLRRLGVRDVVRDASRPKSLARFLGKSSRHVLEDRQEYLEATCRHLGIDATPRLRWPWTDGAGAPAGGIRRAIFAPEAGSPLREWPQDRWILLSRELRCRGWKTELVVHRLPWAPEVTSEFDGIISGSIRDLSCRLRGAALVIAVDSFVGHYAAAHGLPVLSLFGPQLVALWKPWGRGHAVIQHDGYDCRPCLQVRCVQPETSCMKAIALDEVIDVVKRMTASEPPGPPS